MGSVQRSVWPVVTVVLLTTLLVACSPPAERQTSLRAIARWEDRRLAPPDSLAAMITSRDAHVRQAAVRAAGLIGRRGILPELLAALNDRSQTVRCEAAFSLGVLGDSLAAAALTERLRDDHEAIRIAAMQGLALLPGDGGGLFRPAMTGSSREAVAAWDALIHLAAGCARDSLAPAITAALSRPEHDVRWRALRCAQRAPDSTLIAVILPSARDSDPQVRSHAISALGKLSGRPALEAVARSGENLGRLRGYDRVRCQVEVMRALGRLAAPVLAADSTDAVLSLGGRVASLLTAAAAGEEPFASEAALAAMAAIVADQPLPAAASEQESLLPVWRIRMVRAARAKLSAAQPPAVQAAALEAFARLRGRGWDDADLELPVGAGAPAVVQGAWLRALAHVGSARQPARPLVEAVAALRDSSRLPAVRVAAAEALGDCWQRREIVFPDQPDLQDHAAIAALTCLADAGRRDVDFTVRATCAGLLARFPLGWTLEAILQIWPAADLPAGEATDVRLACLAAIADLVGLSRDEETPRALTAPQGALRCSPAWLSYERLPGDTAAAVRDSVRAWDLDVAPHGDAVAAVLRHAFDDPDLRVRLRARRVAHATGFLTPPLIPTEASLRATLPAHRRSPKQPPVALPHAADHVRCVTDRGEFEIALDGEVAPNTCASFEQLIAEGFYDDQVFHRVVADFVIQGGDPRGDGWGGPGYTLRSEWSRLTFARGVVGIAHDGKDTGGSQFFVCLSAQPHLDGRYTIFGKVVRGMDVVDRIQVGDRFRLEIVRD